MRSVAEKLEDSNVVEWFAYRRGPLGVDLRHVRRTLNVLPNVDARPFPANGSRICVPSGRPVGPSLIDDRGAA